MSHPRRLPVPILVVLASTLLVHPARADGPRPEVLRVGVIAVGPRSLPAGQGPAPLYDVKGLKAGLRKLGIRYRITTVQGKPDELAGLARKLVNGKRPPHVIVGIATSGVDAARQATLTIPILTPNVSDPIKDKIGVATLWKPGANVSGLSAQIVQITPTRLELFQRVVGPRLKKVMTLYRDDFGPATRSVELLKAEGARLGIQVVGVQVKDRQGIVAALQQISQAGIDGIIMTPDALVAANNDAVVDASRQHRIPFMGVHAYLAGPKWDGLASVGTNPHGAGMELARRIKLIRDGEKPGDLPFVNLPPLAVLNLKVAREMGITVSPEVVKLFDQVLPAR